MMNCKISAKKGLLLVVTGMFLLSAYAGADEGKYGKKLYANLTGEQEVPPVTTSAAGKAKVSINKERNSVDYSLKITSGFNSPVTQVHIHAGDEGQNGPPIFFLCTDLGNAPANTMVQPCSTTLDGEEKKLSGTLGADDFVAQPNAGIATFDDALKAIKAGSTYINIHTAEYGPGEIRGQVGKSRDKDKSKDKDKDRSRDRSGY